LSAIDCEEGLRGVSVRAPRSSLAKPQVLKHFNMPGHALDPAGLTALARSISLDGAGNTLVLNRGEYQVFLIDKPVVPPEEIEQSLRWVAPFADFSPDDANLSWIPVPKSDPESIKPEKVYLVAGNRHLVDAKEAAFEDAKLKLMAVDVRESSHRNIAAHIKNNGKGVCLVAAEKTGVQITVTWRGNLYLERFIREPLLEETLADTPIDAGQLDRVALEVQRSLDFIHREHPNIPLDQIFVAPTVKDIHLAQELGKRLVEPVRELDLGSIFEWPAGSDLIRPEVQAQYLNALGATLRYEGTGK
jgi:hypothetical protein